MQELSSTLYALRLVKLVLEVLLLALVGQGVMWAMIRGVGRDPATNIFYSLLQVVVSPFVKAMRFITPKFVADRHVPLAVLALAIVAYVWTLFAIAHACIGHGVPVAECRQVR